MNINYSVYSQQVMLTFPERVNSLTQLKSAVFFQALMLSGINSSGVVIFLEAHIYLRCKIDRKIAHAFHIPRRVDLFLLV